jgi:transposase
MTGKIEHVEVITSVQRRRRWAAEEKAAIVQETYAPGMSVSLVARRLGISRLAASSSRAAAALGQENLGERDPARGAGSGAPKKRLLRAPSPARDDTR